MLDDRAEADGKDSRKKERRKKALDEKWIGEKIMLKKGDDDDDATQPKTSWQNGNEKKDRRGNTQTGGRWKKRTKKSK